MFGEDKAICAWVAERMPPGTADFDAGCTAIGIAHGTRLVAGVVYHTYRLTSIEASIAADYPGWCQRGVLAGIFHYPFEQLKVRRMTCLVARRNRRSLKFVQGIGFTVEGLAREGFLDDDAVILGMLRRECRWLPADEMKEAA